jgi:hypothetical protein
LMELTKPFMFQLSTLIGIFTSPNCPDWTT